MVQQLDQFPEVGPEANLARIWGHAHHFAIFIAKRIVEIHHSVLFSAQKRESGLENRANYESYCGMIRTSISQAYLCIYNARTEVSWQSNIYSKIRCSIFLNIIKTHTGILWLRRKLESAAVLYHQKIFYRNTKILEIYWAF